MLNLGLSEILLFAIITLVILGPEKLPEASRFAGRWYGKIKRLMSNVQTDIDRELRMSELREQMQQELDRIKQLEEKMHTQMQELKEQDELPKSQPFKAKKQEQLTFTKPKIFYFCSEPDLPIPFITAIRPVSSPMITELRKAV